jgi:hypothetical protein
VIACAKRIAARSRAVSASLSGCQIAPIFASDTPSPASWWRWCAVQ